MSSVQAALYSSPHPQINHSHQSSSKNNHSTSENPNHSALAGFNRLITMGLPKTMMIHRKNPEYHSQCGIATPKSGKTLDNYNFNRRPSTSLTSEIQNSAPVLISNSAQLSSSTTSALLPRRRKAGYGQSRSERPSTASGSLTSTSLSSSVKASSSSSTTNIKLPCVILSTQVPNKQGLVFGQPIRRDKAQLPFIITRCLTYLNHWGCLEEGIYRIPGRASDVEKLKALFDAGMNTSFHF
ncbi:hypothetical protein BY996DRAFT_1718116 [Phakopsora pachyrhizi]|nr:hypothetical protein BY996DRAFT_1718116 [Phakopsora pachyrhizi]